jgi:hypothetical protein
MSKHVQKILDKKHLGAEPVLTKQSKDIDLVNAYNWYNYHYTNEEAKDFTVTYLGKLKKLKQEKDDIDKIDTLIKKVKHVPAWKLHNIGWNMKLLDRGNSLPREAVIRAFDKLKAYADDVVIAEEKPAGESAPVVEKVSIQDRIKLKASDLIGQIEEAFDSFFENKKPSLDIKEFMVKNDIKGPVATIIIEKFKPRYSDAFDAASNRSPDLVEEFSGFKKATLKHIVEFYREIITQAETRVAVAKASRKPRKKKEKPAAVQVAKMKFKEKDEELGWTSVRPADIIGAEQLWVYNTKTRYLSVYNSSSLMGLSVQGSSIKGYDEKTSITKKLRKPKETTTRVIEGGKVVLRKIMEEIKTKDKEASGRINTDTIILRVIR